MYNNMHVLSTNFAKMLVWRSLLTQYAYSSTCTLLILCVIALNINYQSSKLGYRRKYTQRYETNGVPGASHARGQTLFWPPHPTRSWQH